MIAGSSKAKLRIHLRAILCLDQSPITHFDSQNIMHKRKFSESHLFLIKKKKVISTRDPFFRRVHVAQRSLGSDPRTNMLIVPHLVKTHFHPDCIGLFLLFSLFFLHLHTVIAMGWRRRRDEKLETGTQLPKNSTHPDKFLACRLQSAVKYCLCWETMKAKEVKKLHVKVES